MQILLAQSAAGLFAVLLGESLGSIAILYCLAVFVILGSCFQFSPVCKVRLASPLESAYTLGFFGKGT